MTTNNKTPKSKTAKAKPSKSRKKVSNVIDFETGEPIKLRARSRGSIKQLNELNRFLALNKKNKIKGYVLAYLHEPSTKEEREAAEGQTDHMFSYTVDGLGDAESLTRLYFWLDHVRAYIAESLMA